MFSTPTNGETFSSTICNDDQDHQRNLNVYHHQQRPYFGQNGAPYILHKQTLIYPANGSTAAQKWRFLREENIRTKLDRAFPKIYVLTHAICLFALSLILIGLQIALMATNGALWFVASGIWGGVYFGITALVTIYFAIKRTYLMYLITYALHAFGILMAIGAFLIVNIIAISEYTRFCSYYPNCFNDSVKALNYISFFLGVICIIMLIVFMIVLPCYILNVFYEYRNYKQMCEKKLQQPNEVQPHSILYAQENLDDLSAHMHNIAQDDRIPVAKVSMIEAPSSQHHRIYDLSSSNSSHHQNNNNNYYYDDYNGDHNNYRQNLNNNNNYYSNKPTVREITHVSQTSNRY